MKQEKIKADYLSGVFIYSSGVLLLLTGIAKLISSSGGAKILNNPDPVFQISFRSLLCAAAVAELGIAAACFFCKGRKLRVGLIAVLASNFVLYRIGLLWLGFFWNACPCLGFLTDALHVSQSSAETVMTIVLAYLFIGGYSVLCWLWWRERQVSPAQPFPEPRIPAA